MTLSSTFLSLRRLSSSSCVQLNQKTDAHAYARAPFLMRQYPVDATCHAQIGLGKVVAGVELQRRGNDHVRRAVFPWRACRQVRAASCGWASWFPFFARVTDRRPAGLPAKRGRAGAIDKVGKPQRPRCACGAAKGVGLPEGPEREEARERVAGNAAPGGRLRKRRLGLWDYPVQQLIKKTGSLTAKGLGIAHGSVASPGAQLAIPIEPSNGDKGEWRAVELSAAIINITTVAHNHGKVDDGCAFGMLCMNGYLLLMRFHDGLLSAL